MGQTGKQKKEKKCIIFLNVLVHYIFICNRIYIFFNKIIRWKRSAQVILITIFFYLFLFFTLILYKTKWMYKLNDPTRFDLLHDLQDPTCFANSTTPLNFLTSISNMLSDFVISLQVTLGISTLLSYVPVSLGTAHQAGALTLLTFMLLLNHTLRRPSPMLLKSLPAVAKTI